MRAPWDPRGFVYRFEHLLLESEDSLMRIVRIAGVIWFLGTYGLWTWGQVRDIEGSLMREQQIAHERQSVTDERITEIQKRIGEGQAQAELTRTMVQQVINDMTFLRGIVIGIGGLMTFLQFLTVMAQYRNRERGRGAVTER